MPSLLMKPESLSEKLCYMMALAFLQTPLREFGFRAETQKQFETNEACLADRLSDVKTYAELFHKFVRFEGKTVVELGCSQGYLLNGLLQHEQFSAIGAELNELALELGRSKYGDSITFVQTTAVTIPLPDESIDAAYTIDSVEHFSCPKEIFLEIFRVLKPGGLFLVHFNPWLNPYGSHLCDIIPFPWSQVVFSMETLLKVAAKLYETPSYPVAWYWYDLVSGAKRPNPYVDRQEWDTYLNHMTIRRFNRLLGQLPFEKVHQERIGFGGKNHKFSRRLYWLAKVPRIDEFFTNAVFTVLKKPGEPAAPSAEAKARPAAIATGPWVAD
jgi:ubiquinone/menaquinone biosynthesis C-methylase UbiE